MRCPFCNHEDDRVVDSRASKEGRAIRRRRECLKCESRFTTYEYVENVSLTIVKNDKRREPYDRQKLLKGFLAACAKRPISIKRIENAVDKIERYIEELSRSEITSAEIGKLVMDELYHMDRVAYVRFASVYRNFTDADQFISEVKEMDAKPD